MMLSRACFLSGQQPRALVAFISKAGTVTSSSSLNLPLEKRAASTDVAKAMRPVRQEPGKVRYTFVPEEWFEFFYKKTGVTGPYTFAFTLSTYLMSKEIYVMEHEFYTGLSMAILWGYGIYKFGPVLAKYLDKEIDDYEASMNSERVETKKILNEQIKDEEHHQWSMEGQNILVQAKRENVAMQLEAAFRARAVTVYNEVKKRLDYQVEMTNVERRMAQKNLVDWVVNKVKASITPDQEKQNIDKCISDLALLAKA